MLRYILLGILNYQSMNGYEIKQFMDQSTAHFWHAKLSQVYVTLKALEGEGLLVSEVQAQADRPDRRVYTITDAGRKALRQWLAEPITEIEPTKEPVLVKLFFSGQMDKETILTQLRVQRALRQRVVDLYREETAARIQQSVELNPQLARDALLWEATRRLGEMTEELVLRWLDETIQMIEMQF